MNSGQAQPVHDTRTQGFNGPMEHLTMELAKLDLYIKQAVETLRGEQQSAYRAAVQSNGGQPLFYISHEEVDALLAEPSPPQAGVSHENTIKELDALIKARVAASEQSGVTLPIVHLARLFQLSEFEYHVLVMCLAPELRRKYDRLYAYLQDDITRKKPSVELALQLMFGEEQHRWQARAFLDDNAALKQAGLIQTLEDPQSPSGNSGLAQFIQLDPRIVAFCCGDYRLHPELQTVLNVDDQAVAFDDVLADSQLKSRLWHHLESRYGDHARGRSSFLIYLYGPAGVGKRTLAGALCKKLNTSMLVLDMKKIKLANEYRWLDLAFRESLLLNTPLYLAHFDSLQQDDPVTVQWFYRLQQAVKQFGWLVFAGGEKRWLLHTLLDMDSISCHMNADETLNEKAWRRFAANDEANPSVHIELLAHQYNLTPGRIAKAMRQARITKNSDQALTDEDMFQACRDTSNQKLRELSLKIDPIYRWDDIVLPKHVEQALRSLCAQVKHKYTVMKQWGFKRKLAYGQGVTALFTGTPGTGKTMAAQVIAADLNLDLYKIDLSSVVSKYIGETEKNLKAIFDEAETSNAVLMFDECDALFGKRTEVSDAHDRYANIEVSYLLQRMEEYTGIAILTTNLRKNIDDAFVRRLRFIIEFPFPDESNREQIWRNHIPGSAPVDDGIDYPWLAKKFSIAGGHIRNCVLFAAFAAAEQSMSIGMTHLVAGARQEYGKIGKLWDEKSYKYPPSAQRKGKVS